MATLDAALVLMSSHRVGYLRNAVHPTPNGNRNPHASAPKRYRTWLCLVLSTFGWGSQLANILKKLGKNVLAITFFL
ncbi:MAG: hypothetical protein ACM3IH_07555 [Sphingobacteriales bacterium]|jgi:hypothetical protein